MKAFPLSALSAVALIRHGQPCSCSITSAPRSAHLSDSTFQDLATGFIGTHAGRAASHCHYEASFKQGG